MRISHNYKFVFLANPRTGSSSTRRYLDAISDVKSVHIKNATEEFPFFHHINAAELKAAFEQKGWDWSEYRKFSVVRNPYDRLVSLYHFHQREQHLSKVNSKYSLFERYFVRNDDARLFRRYVSNIKAHHRLAQGLKDFVCDTAGNLLIDDILEFEQLSTQLPNYLQKLGVTLPSSTIPKLNGSPSRNTYQHYYDSKTRHRVSTMYQFEIERFGYKF